MLSTYLNVEIQKSPSASSSVLWSVKSLVFKHCRHSSEPMDIQDKSQSSREENREEGDDDIIGKMEIDDAGDMNEVAGILLNLNVSFFHPHRCEDFQSKSLTIESSLSKECISILRLRVCSSREMSRATKRAL